MKYTHMGYTLHIPGTFHVSTVFCCDLLLNNNATLALHAATR